MINGRWARFTDSEAGNEEKNKPVDFGVVGFDVLAKSHHDCVCFYFVQLSLFFYSLFLINNK